MSVAALLSSARSHRHWWLAPLVLLALGADCQYPKDPKNTLERAQGGTLRVGISDAAPWSWTSDDGERMGVEVELVQGYAEQINATIDWESGSQHELLERLHGFELDIVIGGLTSTSPWKTSVGFTRPFVTLIDSADIDKKHKHVMAIAPGENALLTSLERYLIARKSRLEAIFPEAVQ